MSEMPGRSLMNASAFGAGINRYKSVTDRKSPVINKSENSKASQKHLKSTFLKHKE